MEQKRPDPEQLLRQIKDQSKQRGKLKIFFGACAGAGKTYAMLSAAQEKHRETIDVIAGIVEAHGRVETIRLKEGIPSLPLRQVEYQGITLKEFNLDAALEREPAILLVDELAHTNVIGSRHPKRWQDVQELLEAGIDVYTTLNVQHLETLNDTVANITGVRVKETVPDFIFDNAHEIVLVDVPSEVILERLEDGKVYLGEFTKQRAVQHFFKIENLIALREIALRRTAERVDALRDIYQKYKGVGQRQLIAEKMLVCIGPGTLSTKLVRTAKQQAMRLKCPWTVLYVENEEHYRLADEERLFIEKTMRLAEQLGGSRQILQESKKAVAITNFAMQHNFSRILVGKSSKPAWKRKFARSLVYEIIERSKNVDVYVTHEEPFEREIKIEEKAKAQPWLSYLTALIILVMCTLMGLPLRMWLGPENEVMIYLVGVVIIAASFDRRIAVSSAILSVILYKFFFTEPFYHVGTYHIRDIVTLSVLLLTSLVISHLTAQLRLQHLFAREREKHISDRYALSVKLMGIQGKSKITHMVAQHIGDAFKGVAMVWLPDENGYLELASHPDAESDLKEASVAQWTYQHQQVAGFGTDTMPSARGYYIPLTSGEHRLGVLGIIPKDPKKVFTADEIMLLEDWAQQAASALARVKKV
jgi:two-component system sensor histidine kinase KdpD